MREKSFDSMNVVPFIDIMLVLLVIVLATATFISTGAIPIDLPEVSASNSPIESVVIDLSMEGTVYYEATPHTLEQLSNTLKALSLDTQITVRADKEADIQSFASLMTTLQSIGFEKINLQTQIVAE